MAVPCVSMLCCSEACCARCTHELLLSGAYAYSVKGKILRGARGVPAASRKIQELRLSYGFQPPPSSSLIRRWVPIEVVTFVKRCLNNGAPRPGIVGIPFIFCIVFVAYLGHGIAYPNNSSFTFLFGVSFWPRGVS